MTRTIAARREAKRTGYSPAAIPTPAAPSGRSGLPPTGGMH